MPINIKKDWKAKLESAYSFMLKYSKITVWFIKYVPILNFRDDSITDRPTLDYNTSSIRGDPAHKGQIF